MLETQSGKYKRLMTSINLLLHQFDFVLVNKNSLTLSGDMKQQTACYCFVNTH